METGDSLTWRMRGLRRTSWVRWAVGMGVGWHETFHWMKTAWQWPAPLLWNLLRYFRFVEMRLVSSMHDLPISDTVSAWKPVQQLSIANGTRLTDCRNWLTSILLRFRRTPWWEIPFNIPTVFLFSANSSISCRMVEFSFFDQVSWHAHWMWPGETIVYQYLSALTFFPPLLGRHLSKVDTFS